MGGLMSRNKGKRAEREIVKLLQPIVTKEYMDAGLEAPELERNLMQSHKGGYDIEGLDWMAPEVKHHETLAVNSWWEQTLEQAAAKSREPVLFYRQNNAKWKVRMIGFLPIEAHGVVGQQRLRLPVDIAIDHYLIWFQQRVKVEVKKLVEAEDSK